MFAHNISHAMRNWMNVFHGTFKVSSVGLVYFKSINTPIHFPTMNNAGIFWYWAVNYHLHHLWVKSQDRCLHRKKRECCFREVGPLCQRYWYTSMKCRIREGIGRDACGGMSTFYLVVMRLKQKSRGWMCYSSLPLNMTERCETLHN